MGDPGLEPGRFFGLTITMYFDDHGPPHFHARAAGHSAKVQIDTLEVLVSDLPRRELRLCTRLGRDARGGTP